MKYGYIRSESGLELRNNGISADWNPQIEAEQFIHMVRKGKCSLKSARAMIGISDRQLEVLISLCEGSNYLIKCVTAVANRRKLTLGVFDRLWDGTSQV